MSEPYLFPMEFSGDPCRNMMVEVVLWSTMEGDERVIERSVCCMEEKKEKRKKGKKQMSDRPRE